MVNAKEFAAARPNRCPTHPGAVLRDNVLPALRLSVKGAAAELRISRQTLHRILAGEVAVTPHMAVRLGKFCGNGAGLWLRMQQAHDLWLRTFLKKGAGHARRRRRVAPWR